MAHVHVSLLCRVNFDPDTIRSRLRELAFLNSAATINFKAGKASQAPADGASQNISRKAQKSGKRGQAEVRLHFHHAERAKGQRISAAVTPRQEWQERHCMACGGGVQSQDSPCSTAA